MGEKWKFVVVAILLWGVREWIFWEINSAGKNLSSSEILIQKGMLSIIFVWLMVFVLLAGLRNIKMALFQMLLFTGGVVLWALAHGIGSSFLKRGAEGVVWFVQTPFLVILSSIMHGKGEDAGRHYFCFTF